MPKLLIATRSKGKFPEIVSILQDTEFKCLNLRDIPKIPNDFEVEEPAATFEGNAIIKAMTIGNMTNILTAAEDAGLEVDALDGRPGIYTARYAPGTDEDRYNKLLDELRDIPQEKRTARFKAVVAIYNPKNNKVRTCEATYEGLITTEPKGQGGFGYDPVFYSTELNKTSAEMSKEEKNSVSHRGKVWQKTKNILREDFLE